MAERENRLSLLLDLGSMLAREVDLDALLGAMAARVARALQAERATVFLVDATSGELRSRVADLPEMPEIRLPAGRGVAGYVADSGEVVNVRDATREPRHYAGVDEATGYTTRTLLAVPIRDARRATRGVLQVLNKHAGVFTADDEAFLLALAGQVALALERTTLRPAVGAPRGVQVRGVFNHIVGASVPMRRVYDQVTRAAAVDATVLLRGETGTGKGLIARAVHANSLRRAGPFVTVDCTTLPAPLVESELFGHERGAYTGADNRVPGKVETAAGGTLFLDEVGELPVTLQAKLLRFLQDRTFERLGGRSPLRADVRIVAATHRDLESLVARGEFRQDLFYRLRVVEIPLPGLRERGADEITALADHFLDVYARRYDRTGVTFTPAARTALAAHRWPGNVRELEHAVERAVVLTGDEWIRPDQLGLPATGTPREAANGDVDGDVDGGVAGGAPGGKGGVALPLGLSLEEAGRRYAEATLAAAGGNRSEAARTLGVGRNTLRRKTRGPG